MDFINLMRAVEFIENSLTEPLSVDIVAAAAFISPSQLQKAFRHAFHSSVGDYIVKRKICAAAACLTETTKSVTDIAYEFGYENAESFSRAFRKIFRCSPSVFRRERTFTDLYPKRRIISSITEDKNMSEHLINSRYDITAHEEKILSSRGTYIMGIDIDNMLLLNKNLGHAAGDVALAETSARIESSLILGASHFRLGGDTFIVLTGSSDRAAAEAIAAAIVSHNGDDVAYSGGSFRFGVSIGITLVPEDIAGHSRQSSSRTPRCCTRR